MMASSLPHVTSNHVSYNGLYGVAVFSQKDGSGEFPGGHGAQENFSEDGDAILWETELEKDDDPLRRPITIALVESNSVNHNGGEHPSLQPCRKPSHARPALRPFSLISHFFSHPPGIPTPCTSIHSLLLPPHLSPFSCPKFAFSHPHVPNNADLRALACHRCVLPPGPASSPTSMGAETVRFWGCFISSDRQ